MDCNRTAGFGGIAADFLQLAVERESRIATMIHGAIIALWCIASQLAVERETDCNVTLLFYPVTLACNLQ